VRTSDSNGPDEHEVNQFWNDIWGTPRRHDSSAKWLNDLYSKHDVLPEQPSVSLSVDNDTGQVKMSNWKSPQFDQIQVFWIKK